MILRKPFGILIKNFKIIHLFLSILIGITTYNLYYLNQFFNELSSTNIMNLTEIEVNEYYSFTKYLVIIGIIIISLIVFVLMRFKKKPKFYYLTLIIINILTIILYIFTKSYMFLCLEQTPNPVTTGIYRDITFVAWIFYFSSIFFSILRTIGFSVKKFDFKKDIADLKLEDVDSEEIEVNINVNKHELKRKYNKKKYAILSFIKAKKLIFILVFILILLYSAFLIYREIFIYNKTYEQNYSLNLGTYSIKVNKSLYTNMNYKYDKISDKHKYFVIDFELTSFIDDLKFDSDQFFIESNDKSYFPVYNSYKLFKDIGIGYNKQMLDRGEKEKFILAFRIDNKDNFDINDVLFKKQKQIIDGRILYHNIKLNPIGNNNNANIKSVNIGEPLTLFNKNININSYDINKEFTYNYEFCISDTSCLQKNGKLKNDKYNILKISFNKFEWTQDFVSDYAYITYDKLFTKDNYIRLHNITPKYVDNEMYFLMDKDIEWETNIKLNFLMRDKKYVYTLKD